MGSLSNHYCAHLFDTCSFLSVPLSLWLQSFPQLLDLSFDLSLLLVTLLCAHSLTFCTCALQHACHLPNWGPVWLWPRWFGTFSPCEWNFEKSTLQLHPNNMLKSSRSIILWNVLHSTWTFSWLTWPTIGCFWHQWCWAGTSPSDTPSGSTEHLGGR